MRALQSRSEHVGNAQHEVERPSGPTNIPGSHAAETEGGGWAWPGRPGAKPILGRCDHEAMESNHQSMPTCYCMEGFSEVVGCRVPGCAKNVGEGLDRGEVLAIALGASTNMKNSMRRTDTFANRGFHFAGSPVWAPTMLAFELRMPLIFPCEHSQVTPQDEAWHHWTGHAGVCHGMS